MMKTLLHMVSVVGLLMMMMQEVDCVRVPKIRDQMGALPPNPRRALPGRGPCRGAPAGSPSGEAACAELLGGLGRFATATFWRKPGRCAAGAPPRQAQALAWAPLATHSQASSKKGPPPPYRWASHLCQLRHIPASPPWASCVTCVTYLRHQ